MKIWSNAIILIALCCLTGFSARAAARVARLYLTVRGKEYRHTFLYNAAGQVQLETRHMLAGDGDWLRERQTEWYYEEGRCVKQVRRVMDGDGWRNTDEVATDYNRVDMLTDERVFRYVDNRPDPVRRTKYSYANGIPVTREEYLYPEGKEQLAASHAFVYDGGRVVQQLTTACRDGVPAEVWSIRQGYTPEGEVCSLCMSRQVDGAFQPVDSVTWFYDGAGRMLSQRTRTWNVRHAAWENARQTDYEYDEASQLLAETYRRWNGVAWENVCRYLYRYEEGAQRQRTLQTQIYREWRDMMSVRYGDLTDDGRARDIRSEFDFWGGDEGEAVRSHIPFLFNDHLVIREAENIRVEYEDFASGEDEFSAHLTVSVYPNPSDGVFYLSTEQHDILSWSVYDAGGRLQQAAVQAYDTGVIDITTLPRGVYLLRVETTAGTHRQKLVKM